METITLSQVKYKTIKGKANTMVVHVKLPEHGHGRDHWADVEKTESELKRAVVDRYLQEGYRAPLKKIEEYIAYDEVEKARKREEARKRYEDLLELKSEAADVEGDLDDDDYYAFQDVKRKMDIAIENASSDLNDCDNTSGSKLVMTRGK